MPYNGTVDLIAGLRQKNSGTFPLVDAPAVRVTDDKNLKTKLDELDVTLEDLRDSIAEEYTEKNYNVGDYVYHEDKLYRCNTQIQGSSGAGEAWNSAHWDEVKVSEELNNIIRYDTFF